MRHLLLVCAALAVAAPALAQPTALLYDAARNAGAAPSVADALTEAIRFVVPVQEAMLTASDSAAGDSFGFVSVSLSGDRALIGAYNDDDAGSNSGSAYVFVRTGTTWTQEAKLRASDAAAEDLFGRSVSLSGDRALVAARQDDDAGSNSGSAYVFVRTGTTWIQETKLVALDASAGDDFGRSVSLSEDRALIGAGADIVEGRTRGSAYVFVRSGTGWTQEAKIIVPSVTEFASFGSSVSLSGNRALIGAAGDDSRGSAYTFVRTGATWTQEAKLVATNRRQSDEFGSTVSLLGDRALIGAPAYSSDFDFFGSAYIFVWSGTEWSQEIRFAPSGLTPFARFGSDVSLTEDRALIGSLRDDGATIRSGSAYVFVRTGTTWTEAAKLTAGNVNSRGFGSSVSLLGDRALVGAPGFAGVTDTGSAYVFALGPLGTAGAEGGAEATFVLSAPRPNPASGRVSMTLSVDQPQHIRATLVDALGRVVALLHDGEAAGVLALSVDARTLAPGVYAVRVAGAGAVATRRITVVR